MRNTQPHGLGGEQGKFILQDGNTEFVAVRKHGSWANSSVQGCGLLNQLSLFVNFLRFPVAPSTIMD